MLLPEVFKLKSACETVMSATFVISGKEILGGPHFKFTSAIFFLSC
ncbi:hypothetical protein LEP1GSC059_3130 [Leptospira noguchii serovar Panama str. CZ214]|uniref:Uncharacterized protein n=1 Tax=Leptospira noguchii serovar Panama str. CZ214 TaxID=1001595 RepID=T0FN42_9LEPT|nr:hypothetical protein LEP1GSC059_3130 [Leptospira noguchii serovar Panama str. CZ214]